MMTREELLKYFQEKTALMVDTMQKKNADYAGEGCLLMAAYIRSKRGDK